MKGRSFLHICCFCIAVAIFQGCSPNNQQISPEKEGTDFNSQSENEFPAPSASPAELINQETTINLAFSKFENLRSFSEDVQWKKTPLDGKEPSSGKYQILVDLENQIKLTGEDSLVYQGYLFSKDSTGSLKPVRQLVWSEAVYLPELSDDFGFPNLSEADYKISGEITEGANRFLIFDLIFPQIPYEKNNYFGTYSYTDLNCKLFINAKTGYLEKIEESYTFTYKSNFSRDLDGTSNLIQTTRLSDWGETVFTLPEIIEPSNKELADYSGAASELISFKYPKAARLMDSPQTIRIFPANSENYVFITQNATLAIFSLEMETPSSSYENSCKTYFETFYIPSMKDAYPEITLISTDWRIEGDLGFCKGVVLTSPEKKEVIYFVNQPNRIAGAQKRLLPVTLYISVTLDNLNEPDSSYWEWIRTLQFVE
jgi:hypothetical protein